MSRCFADMTFTHKMPVLLQCLSVCCSVLKCVAECRSVSDSVSRRFADTTFTQKMPVVTYGCIEPLICPVQSGVQS